MPVPMIASRRIAYTLVPTSLGLVLVAGTARGVCLVWLGDDSGTLVKTLKARFPKADVGEGDSGIEAWATRVAAHIESPAEPCDVPLDIGGTAFQQSVWAALRAIPPGTTASYAEIARRVGRPKAVRAVGSACGANPVMPVVPCHRVLRTDGSLGGYGFGLDRKRTLLDREKQAVRPAPVA